MTAAEFTQRKILLQAFESLARNSAYVGELLPMFIQLQRDALTGALNRTSDPAKRSEYLQAHEDAQKLIEFVQKRIEQLTEQLKSEPEEE